MDRRYDFKKIEEEVLKDWDFEKEKIEASLQFQDHAEKRFSWVEGPPTANAPPGIHHIEVRVYKDIVLRYKHMQGNAVARKGGWDCHGLPVEVQVEKKLKLGHKKDVIKYGVPKFIAECKTDVFRFIEDWNESTRRLAFWVDLKHAYRTLDTPYMESVWWSLKEIYKKGLIYRGHKVVPYCPRCETPLSTHEVAQGYREVKERSVTVQVKLKDENAHLLVWTTTPWTLPSNSTIAVNKDMEYSYVEDLGEHKGKIFILAKELIPRYFPEHAVKKTVKGSYLANKAYEPIFPYYPNLKNAHRIITADYVNTEEGTGLVHQSSAYGEIDHEVNEAAGVEFHHTVDREGKFVDEVKDFKGLFVKDADPLIIEHLRKNGKLFIDYDYKHDYPFCWRCDTPLLYYAMEAWFIRVSAIRDRLVEENSKIAWYPATIGEGRFGNWIAEAKDWALSRNKFWGTPLPLWVCECGHIEPIGSIEELEKKGRIGGKGIREQGIKIDDLHIMTVDPISIACPHCKKDMGRTPEVIDTWYDSGSAPFAQFHYPFENKDRFEKAHPHDFIVEAVDQTRGWFYTLHVLSVILFGRPAYKSVAVAGLMCDENGEKMSKSKGNIIQPNEVFGRYGVDATRLAMATYPLGNAIRFGHTIFEDTIMPFFNTLWNSLLFTKPIIASYADEKKDPAALKTLHLRTEDQWLLAKTKELVNTATGALDGHDYPRAATAIMSFVNDDLSRWYIKLIRDRVEEDGVVLHHVLSVSMRKALRLLAPFAPYVSDHLYRMLYREQVHFASWPKDEKVDKKEAELMSDMAVAREILAGIFAARDKAGIGVRWPLAEAVFDTEDQGIIRALETARDIILKQANIRKVTVKAMKVRHSMKPDYHALGKEFGTATADVLEAIARPEEQAKVVKAFEEGKDKVKVGQYTILPEHVILVKDVPVDYECVDLKTASIYLQKTLTEELEEEGYTREVIRNIQQLRKNMGLNRTDKVKVKVVTPYLQLAGHDKEICQRVGATRVDVTKEKDAETYQGETEVTVKSITFLILVEKE